MTTRKNPVLIIGAGPTGLMLAIWLTRFGVKVRIIDKELTAGTTSRALVVHARTLEFYHQLGIADAVLERGIKFIGINLWLGGKHRARIPLGDIGEGLSPYPYAVIFPQDAHEKLLIEHLASLGVSIERGVELISLENGKDEVTARIKLQDGSEAFCKTPYLAGCDGARSVVRKELGSDFSGGTYPDLYFVADIEGAGSVMNGELHASIDETDFLAVFPMKGPGHARLIGSIKSETNETTLEWKNVSSRVTQKLGITVTRVLWFSTYHVHHRMA